MVWEADIKAVEIRGRVPEGDGIGAIIADIKFVQAGFEENPRQGLVCELNDGPEWFRR